MLVFSAPTLQHRWTAGEAVVGNVNLYGEREGERENWRETLE